MKKFFFVSAVLASSQLFAQGAILSVDYSHCQQALGFMGPQLSSHGKLLPAPGLQSNPDVKTVQNAEGLFETTYSFKGYQSINLNGKQSQPLKYKVTTDKNGAVTEINTAQDSVVPMFVNMAKQNSLNYAVQSGIMTDSLTYDPEILIELKEGQQQSFISVPFSKLTKEQAKKFGVDIDELRTLRKAKKKESKTLAKIAEGYMKLMNKSSLLLPNGLNLKMEVKDGVCKPTKVVQIAYNATTKKNQAGQVFDHEKCDRILTVQKKYESQLQSCNKINIDMNKELYPQNGGFVGGYGGGGGYGYGGGIGMGMGGYDSYLNNDVFQCQMYFGEMPQGGYIQGGGGGGTFSGVSGGSAGGTEF